MDLAVAVAAGLGVGIALGLLGAGGSLLTVPALVFLLGLTTGQAAGTSLVAVALMAVTGLAVHARAGRCSCREGLAFGAAAAGAAAGAGVLAPRAGPHPLGRVRRATGRHGGLARPARRRGSAVG